MEITVEISFEVTAPTPTCAYRSWNSARSSTKHTAPTIPKALSSLSRVRQVTPRRYRRVSTRGTAIDCTDRGGPAPCMRRRCGDAPASALTEPAGGRPPWVAVLSPRCVRAARCPDVQCAQQDPARPRTAAPRRRARVRAGPGTRACCAPGGRGRPVRGWCRPGGERGRQGKGRPPRTGWGNGGPDPCVRTPGPPARRRRRRGGPGRPPATEAQRRTEVPEEPHQAAEDAQP